MNRAAVAMAADSAVTLSGTDAAANVDKIFQNENKLFELSRHHPIGIMIYHATNFFEVPWEVIIKDFRLEAADDGCDHVYEWADKFMDYIRSHAAFMPPEAKQREFVRQVLIEDFGRVYAEWLQRAQGIFVDKQNKSTLAKYPLLMQEVISERVGYYESACCYEGFTADHADDALNEYENEFLAAKHQYFQSLPLEPLHEGMIRSLAAGVLVRARSGWFTTGLVFAGFGSGELFPSLRCIEVGGVVANRLRWRDKRKVDIDRSTSTAEIIPFAQRETVDTLLFGRSARYEGHVADYFANALSQIGAGFIKQLTRPGVKRLDFEARLQAAASSVIETFYNETAPMLKDVFARDTLDIVRHMPKPDLAAFAESLVTVSSMMRKVTVGPETVGGPVDVAVISRHEGFIWVKRKHYFSPELNQRYLWRAFGTNRGG